MAEILAIPGMILGAGSAGAGAGAGLGEFLGLGGASAASAMPMVDPTVAPAVIGGSTAAEAASKVPKAGNVFGGLDTGVRLGQLAGMGQQPQQQQQAPIVQAPPNNVPQPMQQPVGGFTPSALAVLQAFLQSRNQGY